MICVGGGFSPPEENADLPDFTPERAHLLLREVNVDFPHQNNGSPLDGVVGDDTIWQRRWRRLAAQSASWYATPTGVLRHRFTAISDVEWQGLIELSWKYERPLVFAHVVLTKMLGVRRAREIWERITRRMDLWERGINAGLVGDAEAEGASREGRSASGGEEEEEVVAQSYHETVLSGKIW